MRTCSNLSVTCQKPGSYTSNSGIHLRLCFDNVPGFRYESLLTAPRKDAYYRTFIKDRFLTKPLELA